MGSFVHGHVAFQEASVSPPRVGSPWKDPFSSFLGGTVWPGFSGLSWGISELVDLRGVKESVGCTRAK